MDKRQRIRFDDGVSKIGTGSEILESLIDELESQLEDAESHIKSLTEELKEANIEIANLNQRTP